MQSIHVTDRSRISYDNLETNRGSVGLCMLNDPDEPYLEVIVVHGLLGDSRLTWTFGNQSATYWPEWLTEDSRFSKTRIHTYGYDEPTVDGRIAVSKLRDIGINLCSALESNSDLRQHTHNQIIFIAHSLGGLVVKAAITYANQNIRLQELARRFHAAIFMATPHRDAGDHTMLRNILRACNTSSWAYPDPEPNASMVQDINEDFHSSVRNLRLWSFYENILDAAVSKTRAVLRGGKEMRANGDHANIVRFRSSSDPTYSSITEILHGLATDIQEELENPEKIDAHMRSIAKYLSIPDTADGDLVKIEREKLDGTCDWLLMEDSFKRWSGKDAKDSPTANSRPIYWLSGDPGCGKSFLSAHVVRYLRKLGCDTSFYFVKHGDVSKQTMGTLLKTIAFQMTRTSASLRRSILSMQNEDTPSTEPNDVGAIWRQLFIQKIFRIDPDRRQYWVIDALDEGHGYEDLISQLQSLPKSYSVFITSRKDPTLKQALQRLGTRVVSTQIDKKNTLKDIRTYLERNKDCLHTENSIKLRSLIQKLEEKSKGSFLWTHLIVQILDSYWTEEDIETAVSNIPDGMYPLYNSILQRLSETPNKVLAEAILRWVICATRPMRTAELKAALWLDKSQTLTTPAQAIESICGPLLSVEADRVEVVHDTARDYLFSKSRSSGSDIRVGFRFDKASSNEHIAIICIKFLATRFSPRSRNPSLRSARDGSDSDSFLNYASTNFSEHLARSGTADETRATEKLAETLGEFLDGPILFWIEWLAQQTSEYSLSTLTRSGKNLKAFVARSMSVQADLSPQLTELQEWANDLIHLVTAFGKELLKKPEAIHDAIPPLCPSKSKINREFGHRGGGLQVVGIPRGSWPDRISLASFEDDHATSLASCENRYAVGLRSSQIAVYHATTCQEILRIKTTEPPKRLAFAYRRNWLAASGRKTLKLYNYKIGDLLWTKDTTREILALAFTVDDSELLAATSEKVIESLDTKNGDLIRRGQLKNSKTPGKPPQQIHISEELGLLVVISRNEDVELYDLDSLQKPRGRITHSANIVSLAFNTMKKMLAMSSFDGELFTVGAQSLKRFRSTESYASYMAVSTDGKTLVVGTNQGDIQIYEFDSLKWIYNIPYDEDEVLGVCFASSSLRFLDIRRQVFNIWEPAALVRRNDDDDSGSSAGQSTFTSAPSRRGETTARSDQSAITAVVQHHSGEYVFCAKESGAVVVYDTSRGKPKLELFEFGKMAVLFLAWNKNQNLLASADNSSTVKVHKISSSERVAGGPRENWDAEEILQLTLEQPIRQVLLSPDGDVLLISATTKEYVFSTKDGSELLRHDCAAHSATTMPRSQKWVTCSWNKRQFLEIQSGPSHAISWGAELPPKPVIKDAEVSGHLHHDKIHHGCAHLVKVNHKGWAAYDHNPSSGPVIWSRSTDVSAVSESPGISLRFNQVAPQVGNFLGMYRGKLVFLGSDRWVCSMRLDEERLDDPVEYHFPLPYYWASATRHLLAFVSTKGDIVIAVDGDLAIVKNALSP